MSTASYSNTSRDTRTADGSSREIQKDIQQTRHEMDETIDKLGERLDPRNLVDRFLDMFRGSGDASTGEQISTTLKTAGETTVDLVREHPVPALLCGAGALWWVVEQSLGTHSGSSAAASGRGKRVMSSPSYPAQTWRQEVPAWHGRYDWSQSDRETEADWNARVDKALTELKQVDQSGVSHDQRIRHAAGKLVNLSGHKRSEIHARWANLREHSGSFVDARTGEPYDSSYGQEWRHLASADAVASDYEENPDESWSEKASESWKAIQSSLEDTQSSAKDRLGRIAQAVSHYANQTGKSTKAFGSSVAGTASHWASAVGSSAAAAGHYTSDAAHHAAAGLASGAEAAQHQVVRGAQSARHALDEAVREYPLAVGAACLGLGLLAGLAVPHTRYEDEMMGEASDEFKEDAFETGKEAVESGKRVASKTASAAMDEAEKQGLTPQQLGESARKAAHEAAGAVRQSVSKATHEAKDEGSHLAEGASRVAERAAETAKKEASKEAGQHRPK